MDIDTWIKDAAEKELQIRKFLEEHGILTVPKWVQHYTLRPTPEYLRALEFTEHDDFTSPSRLNENCIRYVPEPVGKTWLLLARDSDGSAADHRSRRDSRAIIFSFVSHGKTTTRSGVTTTIPAPMKGSAFTPRK